MPAADSLEQIVKQRAQPYISYLYAVEIYYSAHQIEQGLDSRRSESHRVIRSASRRLHCNARGKRVQKQIDKSAQVHSENVQVGYRLIQPLKPFLDYLNQIIGIYIGKVVNRSVVIQIYSVSEQIYLYIHIIARDGKYRLGIFACGIAFQRYGVFAAAHVRRRFPLEVDCFTRRKRGSRPREYRGRRRRGSIPLRLAHVAVVRRNGFGGRARRKNTAHDEYQQQNYRYRRQ